MAGEKLLSETQCKNAKPKAKVYYLNDGVDCEFYHCKYPITRRKRSVEPRSFIVTLKIT